MGNEIAVTFSEEEITEINQAITTLDTILLPRLVNLNAKERQSLPKMGDGSVSFVQKCVIHMDQNPDLIPKYISVSDMKIDLKAVEILLKFQFSLMKSADMLDDSILLSGSEALVSALAFYNYIQGAAKANVPGADVIYKDLRVQFKNKGKKTN
jgi:hypothetical protein